MQENQGASSLIQFCACRIHGLSLVRKRHSLTYFFDRLQFKGSQTLLDDDTIRFEPFRQFERFSQGIHRFIRGKPRVLGGNLEQHTTLFSEVNRVEITPIEYLRDVETCLANQALVFQLLMIGRNTKSDMVNGSHPKPRSHFIGTLDKVHDMPQTIRIS